MKLTAQRRANFITAYTSVLQATANRVHYLAERGHHYVSTGDVAKFLIGSLPTLSRKTWGREVKVWRVRTMLSNANFFGAFDMLDIKAVRGKGLAAVVKPRRARLRLIKGGA